MVVSDGSQRVYLDTNVFINYLYDEARVDLVEASEDVFDAVVACRFFLVVSDVTVREIVKVTGFSRDEVFQQVFRPYLALSKMELVQLNGEAAEEATYYSSIFGVHMLDAFHMALASLHRCWLVTFDGDLKDAASRAGLRVFDPRDLGL